MASTQTKALIHVTCYLSEAAVVEVGRQIINHDFRYVFATAHSADHFVQLFIGQSRIGSIFRFVNLRFPVHGVLPIKHPHAHQ